jgi:hypothetical protein
VPAVSPVDRWQPSKRDTDGLAQAFVGGRMNDTKERDMYRPPSPMTKQDKLELIRRMKRELLVKEKAK